MKFLIVCLLLAGGALAKTDLRSEDGELSAVLNDYVDEAIPTIIEFLVENGFDPLDLPYIFAEFTAKPIIITYHGILELTQGILYNVRSLHRAGDVILTYSDKKLRVTGSFGIRDIEFEYNYRAKLMNIGPVGRAEGSLSGANIYFDIEIDFETLDLSLREFKINNVGSIRVRLTGNILTDWLANILIRVITAIFKDNLIGFLEDKMRGVVEDFIDEINNNIGLSQVLLDTKLHGISYLIHYPRMVKAPLQKPSAWYLDMTHVK